MSSFPITWVGEYHSASSIVILPTKDDPTVFAIPITPMQPPELELSEFEFDSFWEGLFELVFNPENIS